MRRVVLLAGVTLAAVMGIAFARNRLRDRGPESSPLSGEDRMFTQFAPGGPEGFWFNGLLGRVFAKVQPLGHAGLYTVVAEMLELQPEDELLDIGCGPGAFMARKAGHVRRVVGLDPSRTMLDAAEKTLTERIAAGTARLVQASAADLPFGDDEFSVITAITAPANVAEVFRVLRPGGYFVWVDELVDDSKQPSAERIGRFGWSEAEFQRVIADAGFIEMAVRYEDVSFPGGSSLAGNRIVACRKPAA
jgi:SAM-dependent methyltransferase